MPGHPACCPTEPCSLPFLSQTLPRRRQSLLAGDQHCCVPGAAGLCPASCQRWVPQSQSWLLGVGRMKCGDQHNPLPPALTHKVLGQGGVLFCLSFLVAIQRCLQLCQCLLCTSAEDPGASSGLTVGSLCYKTFMDLLGVIRGGSLCCSLHLSFGKGGEMDFWLSPWVSRAYFSVIPHCHCCL